MTDSLSALPAAGVSVWLDDLSRLRLTSGTLRAPVRDRHADEGIENFQASWAAVTERLEQRLTGPDRVRSPSRGS